MEAITSLGLRYLLENKIRTALTILGIIISVAMITSIGTILVSFRDAEIERAIDTRGSHHASFMGLSGKQMEIIEKNSKIEKTATEVYVGGGFIPPQTKEPDENFNKLRLLSVDGCYFELTSTAIEEGREPERKNEIALDTSYARSLGASIGDEITLCINYDANRNLRNFLWEDLSLEQFDIKTFNVVGLLSSHCRFPKGIVSPKFSEQVLAEPEYSTYISIKDGLAVQEVVEEIAAENNLTDINYNRLLLTLLGQGIDGYNTAWIVTLFSIVLFLSALVCLATVAVIYNSFNISVLERIKQFGILRSIGATPLQIRKIVFVEATLQCLIAIPLGLISGLLAMKVVFYLLSLGEFSNFGHVKVSISLLVLVGSSFVGVLSVFLSAFRPAYSSSKMQLLEAMFYRPKIKKFKKRKGKVIGKILTPEMTLAFKNLQRNKKRFILTSFSLSISVILFIVFSVFTNYIIKLEESRTGHIADYTVYAYNDRFSVEDVDKIKSIEGITKVNPINSVTRKSYLSLDDYSEEYLRKFPDRQELLQYSKIIGYPQVQIQKLLKDEFDVEARWYDVLETNGVFVVQNNLFYEGSNSSVLPVTDFEIGDEIIINKREHDEEEELESLTVMGIVDRVPIYHLNYPDGHLVYLITTDEVLNYLGVEGYNKIFANVEDDLSNEEYEKISSQLWEIKDQVKEGAVRDGVKEARMQRQYKLEVYVFVYGFIALISLIGAINILNTVNTNILTRTKEFSMLKAVGLSTKGLCKMIRYEALFNGLLGVIYGCIVGNLLGYWLYKIIIDLRDIPWEFPWLANLIIVISVFVISLSASFTTVRKMKSLNIIETLKEE
ncbi:FtsX-like permease family protein [Proteinivorax tanatarense]|uniref:FtsX-like permease family protein n=1 Tax=Proteinivorax tanatarense TaxID=1260629 RepID=A0AAU7VKI3_9FIRM